jgi:hypothetical protein
MFVMDNFDIGETKRANENRWLYTIGPQRRTRYPFETLVIPGTHYTLHWFMQCKITDPSQVPEFKYVPISTGATTLPFGTAPYVPTVQISQTKSDWVVVPQEPFLNDAKVILQCLAKCLNQHNFTIFDARDLMHSLHLKLPLISHEETLCELDFLERQRKGIVIGYQNRHKRKSSPVKMEDGPNKRPRLEGPSVSTATRMLLDTLSYGPISFSQAAHQLQVKEKMIEKVVDVLMVVGQVTVSNGLITSTQHILSPQSLNSPTSPLSSCDESYGPIPETPPQAMPMWEEQSETDPFSSTPRPYATRSSTKALKSKRSHDVKRAYSPFAQPPPVNHRPLVLSSLQRCPITLAPPPTEPVRPREEAESIWSHSIDNGSFATSLTSDKFSPKSISTEMTFESTLELGDASLADFFQSSFWDQY